MRMLALLGALLMLGACAGRGAIDDVAAVEFGAAASASSSGGCHRERREPRKAHAKAAPARPKVNW